MQTTTRSTTLLPAIFLILAGIFILVVTVPMLLAGKSEPSVGNIGFSLCGLVALVGSVFFFREYYADKRFEKEREEDEARILANTQEGKNPCGS